jgi:hypothetical protein
MSENRVLRRISGRSGWRILHKEELYNLYAPSLLSNGYQGIFPWK